MNEMIEKMLSRHAIRRFKKEQITEDELNQVLIAGLYAPSAGNNQYSRIVVCQDAELNDKLGRLNRWAQFKDKAPEKVAHSISAEQPSIQDDFTIMSGYYNAPTVLTIFTKNHKYCYEDAAMIGENMLLAAHFLASARVMSDAQTRSSQRSSVWRAAKSGASRTIWSPSAMSCSATSTAILRTINPESPTASSALKFCTEF